jgi:alkanesulfonate monooxygenase SsuD/methylene tetrahydromethanopterin reductase-like flavin-dependent oxidoreductase (luciferase family)
VLGIGSGWQENEHRAYGIEFFDIPTRLDRLAEACELIRSLFTQEKTSFAGKHYQCEDAPLDPKPVRDKLPILVGGGGVKKTLRIVARFADEWNIWGDPQELREKGAVLARHCEAVGRDPAEIGHSAVALLFMTDDPDQAAKLRDGLGGRPTLAGNPDQISETVEQYRQAGVHEIVVPDFTLGEGAARREVLDRFVEEVAPRFR